MNMLKDALFHLDLLLSSPKTYLYSYTISNSNLVEMKPHNKKTQQLGEKVLRLLQKNSPEISFKFVGSSNLGIIGKGDIDIVGGCDKKSFKKYIKQLQNVLGEPQKIRESFVDYRLMYEGAELEVTLMDKNFKGYERQIKVFNYLKGNKAYLEKYKSIKTKANGKSERYYNLAQMKFMNELLKKVSK